MLEEMKKECSHKLCGRSLQSEVVSESKRMVKLQISFKRKGEAYESILQDRSVDMRVVYSGAKCFKMLNKGAREKRNDQ